jgi:uncharacterized protein
MATPKELLNELLKAEGIIAAIISGRDGIVIASAGRTGTDFEALGAVATSGISALEVLGKESENGELDQIIAQYKKVYVVLQLINIDDILLVLASREANLGMVRLAIRRKLEHIAHALKEV